MLFASSLCLAVLTLTRDLGSIPAMKDSIHSTNPAGSAPNSKCSWAWLQSRLQRAAVVEATHELDDWLGQRLLELEADYSSMVTDSSRKILAGALVKARR